MSWKVGQKLVCIKHVDWADIDTGVSCSGPTKDEIVTYDGGVDSEYGYLREYQIYTGGVRNEYALDKFAPIQSTSATTELLNSFIEVLEKSDSPINIPQHA